MTTITRDLFIPVEARTKLKAAAIEKKTTLGEELADVVKRYAEGAYTDGPGKHVDDVEDPGAKPSDVKVRMNVEESVWQQARTRTVMDGTTLASAVRRIVTGLPTS